jgi:Zn-dependent protease/CBS domain-containing protein
VPIATIAGIQVRMHVTFLLLVGLFAIAFSGPDRPGPFAGIAWLLAIFTCVLAHEFAHCLVARRRGGIVHEIVLLPIGGVSKMERLPESPADEFAVAIAGPATSFGIGIGAGLLCLAVGQPLVPVDLLDGAVLHRLAWLNLALAAFNLLPAFPLDGGRVLRSLLERRLDLETATRRAARIGRMFAVLLGAIGILFDLWLVIIAVFVYFGASAEEVATIVHVRLQNRTVGDVMLLDPVVLPAEMTVHEARSALRRTAQRTFPVVASDRYAGSVGARSLLAARADQRVGALVDESAPAVAASDPAEGEALELLRSYDAVPVLRSGAVVGLLQRDDVTHLIEDARRAHDQA